MQHARLGNGAGKLPNWKLEKRGAIRVVPEQRARALVSARQPVHGQAGFPAGGDKKVHADRAVNWRPRSGR